MIQALQTKMIEEEISRTVKKGAADSFGSPFQSDEAPFKKGLQDTSRVHTPNLFDFGTCHGLLVDDNCEGFQPGARETDRPDIIPEFAHPREEFDTGQELITVLDFDQLKAPPLSFILLAQFVEHATGLFQIEVLPESAQSVKTERLIEREKQRLKNPLGVRRRCRLPLTVPLGIRHRIPGRTGSPVGLRFHLLH